MLAQMQVKKNMSEAIRAGLTGQALQLLKFLGLDTDIVDEADLASEEDVPQVFRRRDASLVAAEGYWIAPKEGSSAIT